MTAFRPEAVRLGSDYEVARDEARLRLAAIKSPRRIQLGERLALVFENAATAHAAAEESLRTERVSQAEGAVAHLEAFAAAAPEPGSLSAVLFLDSDDPAGLAESGASLRGVQRSVTLAAGAAQVRGIPKELSDEAPAYHLTFAVSGELRRGLLEGHDVAIVVGHHGTETSVPLSADQRAALLEDI